MRGSSKRNASVLKKSSTATSSERNKPQSSKLQSQKGVHKKPAKKRRARSKDDDKAQHQARNSQALLEEYGLCPISLAPMRCAVRPLSSHCVHCQLLNNLANMLCMLWAGAKLWASAKLSQADARVWWSLHTCVVQASVSPAFYHAHSEHYCAVLYLRLDGQSKNQRKPCRRPVLPSSGQAYDEINIIRFCSQGKKCCPVSGEPRAVCAQACPAHFAHSGVRMGVSATCIDL